MLSKPSAAMVALWYVPEKEEEEVLPTVGENSETWKPTADTFVVISESGAIDFGADTKLIVKKADADDAQQDAEQVASAYFFA